MSELEDPASRCLGVGYALEPHVLRASLYRKVAHVGEELDGVDQHLVDHVERHILRRQTEQTATTMNSRTGEEGIALAPNRQQLRHTA
jgi:hypothetical protein